MSELTPVTRKEQFYDRILQAAESGGGGGGGSTLIEKSISANGIYNASDDSADGYSKVTVDVPNTYTVQDEGKVVDNGVLVAQTTHAEITENGTYDITTNNSVSVNVSGGGVEFSNSPSNFTLLTNIRNLDVNMPDGVSLIAKDAFNGCAGLKSVNIPNSVTGIYQNAFKGCTALTEIEFPESISTMAAGAFYGCINLQSIKFISQTPPTLGGTVFTNLPNNCKIYVPTGTLSAYTSTANMPDPNTYTYVEY